ncbi:HesB/IscA family protein [Halioglobus pacificus]|uniref:Iron-sulfur cluster assembly protein IscA n=1 Tax=Parahalioglobus pacificus TaxID=930806 RepID=A0A919CK19_9GAMM|nr:iron-sulfur cluster assembly accessory protein [Halioglobus pacificus]NQY04070.1 iron-sulfur cluster assembly accessory protein [Halieaceae bacterium]GHD31273.1 iron-sulfur cluster assembly protein IscA [Halioglobus pacificus]
MSVEVFDVNDDVVTITPDAAKHLLQQAQGKGQSGVRISVKESGCTGYMYVMEEVSAGEGDDVTVTADNGLQLFIASDSVDYLRGTQLDYVREGINRTLKFLNPNVTAACGCGESFSIA